MRKLADRVDGADLSRVERGDVLTYRRMKPKRSSGKAVRRRPTTADGSIGQSDVSVWTKQWDMSAKIYDPAFPDHDVVRRLDIGDQVRSKEASREAGALQTAIFNSVNFSSIATDANGVIQIFNVGAERMLGYTAAEVMNQITPADISDPLEVIARAALMPPETPARCCNKPAAPART